MDRMFRFLQNSIQQMLAALPKPARSFRVHSDSFARTQLQLDRILAGLAAEQAGRGEAVILVAQFVSDFCGLERALEAAGVRFSVAPHRPDLADAAAGGVILCLADSLRAMSELVSAGRNAILRDSLPGRLNVMILQRHPLDRLDQEMLRPLRQIPTHLRIGFFLSLDNPLVGIGVPAALVQILEQLGMDSHALISSRMLSKRVRVAQRKMAAAVLQVHPVDSAGEWIQTHLPCSGGSAPD